MLTSIVFSKNRPLQLDLTLKSIKENFPLCSKIVVLYKIDDEYQEPYDTLMKEHNDVFFDLQIFNIVNHIKSYLCDSSYYCFFTDDNIFFAPSKTKESDLDFMSNQACCISLRLGLNIIHRDFGDGLRFEERPHFYRCSKNHIMWNRLSLAPGGYWSYPLSVDGHIFTKANLSKIFDTILSWPEYQSIITPNYLESVWQRFFFEIEPNMMAETTSCVVNSPNNRVQDDFKNKVCAEHNYSPDILKRLYLDGARISLDGIDFSKITCPHYDLDILKGLR